MGATRDGPRGERAAEAARDALGAIEAYRRGELDGLGVCRSLVNDEHLRDIVPIRLLLGFIGVESLFDQSADDEDEHGADPAELAESRAEREACLAAERDALVRDCAALAAHLEGWLRDREEPARDG